MKYRWPYLWHCRRCSHPNRQKIAVVDNLTVIWCPRLGEPPQISTYAIYSSGNWSHWATFLSLSRGCLPKMRTRAKFHESSSRSSKVINFGTNRKRIYDFLFVLNSNLCPILHRFWDTATNWLKIAYFSYPSLIWHPRSLCSLWNFAVKLATRKLVMGLLRGESYMILT